MIIFCESRRKKTCFAKRNNGGKRERKIPNESHGVSAWKSPGATSARNDGPTPVLWYDEVFGPWWWERVWSYSHTRILWQRTYVLCSLFHAVRDEMSLVTKKMQSPHSLALILSYSFPRVLLLDFYDSVRTFSAVCFMQLKSLTHTTKKRSHRIPSFSSCVSVFIPSRALRVPATLPPRSITMMMRRETGYRVPVKVTYRLTGLVGKKPGEQTRKRKNPGQTRAFSNSTMGEEICRSRGGKRIACKTDSYFQPSKHFLLKKSPNQLVPFVLNAIEPFRFWALSGFYGKKVFEIPGDFRKRLWKRLELHSHVGNGKNFARGSTGQECDCNSTLMVFGRGIILLPKKRSENCRNREQFLSLQRPWWW